MRRLSALALVLAIASLAACKEEPRGSDRTTGPTTTDSIRVERAVPFATRGPEQLLMDVYTPAGEGPFPAVELIHGGAFDAGTREMMRGLGLRLAAAGYVAFAIDYRLAPDGAYPAAVDDAKDAITYVRDHADELSVDPSRIGVMGSSAGATIAASVGADGRGSTGSQVAAVVGWSGLFDLPALLETTPASAPILRSYLGVEDLDTARAVQLLREASPAEQVDAGYPPTFLANSQQDIVPGSQMDEMVSALEAANVPYRRIVPATGHGLAYIGTVSMPTLEFLDRELRRYGGGGEAG